MVKKLFEMKKPILGEVFFSSFFVLISFSYSNKQSSKKIASIFFIFFVEDVV